MGKKKSVVLLTLLTIVIVVLCAMIVVPTFTLPFLWNGAVSDWNPVVKTYDLGADLGGGYYTYYYPEGIIPETDYKIECASRAEDEEALEEYEKSYTPYKGLYLSTDFDDGIVEGKEGNYTVAQSFKDKFAVAKKEIAARYEEKGYSSFRVSVVDDYAVRVELPLSDTSAEAAFQYFAYNGEFTLSDGTSTVFEENKDKKATDYFKEFSPKKNGKNYYVMVKLTDKGRSLIKDVTTSLASSSDSSGNSTGGKLSFKVGDNTVIDLSVASPIDEKTLYIGGTGTYTYETAQTVSILLNSAIHAGDIGVSFTVDKTRTFEAAYGSNALTLLYIAIAIVLVASIIFSFIKYRGFGGACMYSTLSYLIVTAICFAFISTGVFEVTLGTMLVFLFGLLLMNFLNAHVYAAIKSEFNTGKTVESSVKAGYKKTLAGTADIYVLLAAIAVALLIGAAGLHTLALQALICFAAGAFCNLLWTRFLNFTMLSIAKNKYKYFGFVREDDDDE